MPQLKRQQYEEVSNRKEQHQKQQKQQKTPNEQNGVNGVNEFEDFTVEREHNVSETFNYETHVIEDGSGSSDSLGFGIGIGIESVARATNGEQLRDDIRRCTQRPEPDHVIIGPLTSDKTNGARDLTLLLDEHTYVNFNFETPKHTTKELLLHKFFRSTVERNGGSGGVGGGNQDTLYENLCRGCGYGVFEAHGQLCYFCASIVNGVRDTPVFGSGEQLDTSWNGHVYENICEKCFAIYSGDECDYCEVVEELNNSTDELSKKPKSPSSTAITKKALTPTVKLNKSKSFNKRSEKTEKRSIFQGLIGSLKRTPKPTKSNSATRLEIVHNVDGYENVFRTQETFDLQRICELKNAQSNKCSSSDQHIYGRLKGIKVQSAEEKGASTQTLPLELTNNNKPTGLPKADSESGYLNTAGITKSDLSLDDVDNNLTNITKKSELTHKKVTGKRPRISKPRLLRVFSGRESSRTAADSNGLKKPASEKQQALYLPDSVCNWMTSLRREEHNYRDDHINGLCNPKSIPAKNSLLTYVYKQQCVVGDYILDASAVSGVNNGAINVADWTLSPPKQLTNTTNIENSTIIVKNSYNRSSDVSSVSSGSSNYDEIVTLRQPNCYGFNEHNQKQTKATKHQHQQVFESEYNVIGDIGTPVVLSQMVNEFKRNIIAKHYQKQMSTNNNSNNGGGEMSDLPLIASVKQNKEQQFESREERRAKRQAIYLKIDERNNNSNNKNEELETSEKKSANNSVELDSTALNESPISRRKTLNVRSTNTAVVETSPSQSSSLNRQQRHKRCGIYEPNVDAEFVCDILNAFDNYLQDEEDAIEARAAVNYQFEYNTAATQTQITPYVAQRDYHQYTATATTPSTSYVASSLAQVFNFVKLSEQLCLSRGLNRLIITYDQPLSAFLVSIWKHYPRKYIHWPERRLIRKFQRFQRSLIIIKPKVNFSEIEIDSTESRLLRKSKNVSNTMAASSDSQSDERNSVKVIVKQLEVVSRTPTVSGDTMTKLSAKNIVLKSEFEKSCAAHETLTVEKMSTHDCSSESNSESPPSDGVKQQKPTIKIQAPLKPHRVAPKRPEPPRVPLRDPRTALSSKPTSPAIGGVLKSASESHIQQMKNNYNNNNNNNQKITHSNNNEESIYQPIWKFKTVGEVQEHYETDADYYEIGDGDSKKATTSGTADGESLPSLHDIEDHGEWETDDEFMFTTRMTAPDKRSLDAQSADITSLNSSTVPSLSGSTVAGFSSSTATLASALSASLTHHLFRNIGIFYSLTQPKIRAIIYDYDRVHASTYFAKHRTESSASPLKSESPCSHHSHHSVDSNANDSGIGKSPKEERSPMPPPRTTSNAAVARAPNNLPKKSSESGSQPLQLLPDSVQAWKFMLLDVNYLEDEEDMIVSETEILRVQETKEDIDTRQTQQLNFLQRFKSVSIGNLVDLPNEDDKKSIAERMRNKLQRGVFKINVRSPKSDKKNRGIFRRAEATSLYLEDGMKPKYPIFGAPLDQLELETHQSLHPNVPRFVVDCVAYIEQKDCIQQEGLYRASGNKVSIEELKQKLSESYIYDPKLIVPDDIHTLTSLLKLFFRELGAPLIPQEIYDRLGRNLSDPTAIEAMSQEFEDMREPNRSTLKFLIRHLTNVAACSAENRMPASNLAIVWGPCIMAANQMEFDIGRMNTLAKVLIENYAQIFKESERLVA